MNFSDCFQTFLPFPAFGAFCVVPFDQAHLAVIPLEFHDPAVFAGFLMLDRRAPPFPFHCHDTPPYRADSFVYAMGAPSVT